MLVSRLLLFVLFGLVFVLVLHITGSKNPFDAVIKWWPFQVVLANLVCFLLLRRLCARENRSFLSLLNFDKKLLAKDMKIFLLLLVVSGPVGYFGAYGAAQLMYAGIPPVSLAQPLPMWALVLAVLLFPASNAFVENTTYFGYSYERLGGRVGGLMGIWIPVLFLALQHIGIPLFFDAKYLVWRFLTFLPTAIVVGAFYFKIRKLFPIMLGQFLVDMIMLLAT
jgi:hypothetical protein